MWGKKKPAAKCLPDGTWLRRAAALAVLLALVVGTQQWGWGYVRGSTNLRNRQSALGRQIQKQREELNEIKLQERQTRQRLAQVGSELDRTNRDMQTARGKWLLAQQREAEAKKGYEAAEVKYGNQKEAFQERIVELYMKGDTTYLEVLLEATDFYDVVNRAYLCKKLMEADMKLFASIRQEKETLAKAKQLWNERAADAQATQASLKDKEGVLATVQKRHQVLLASTVEQRKQAERDLAVLEQANRDVEAMIRQMMRSGQMGRAPRWSGSYLVPLSGTITSGFGYRFHPILRQVKMHTGVDIAAPVGTSIIASAGGVVVFSGWMKGYGKMVMLDHGGGISTLYAHCSSLAVSVGQQVRQGQLVGRVGLTGLTTGPHLHWEKRVNGRPVNPL